MVSELHDANRFPPFALSLVPRPGLLFSPFLIFLVRGCKVKHMLCVPEVQKWKEILTTVNGSTAKSDTTFYCFKRYRWIFDSHINILPDSAELLERTL